MLRVKSPQDTSARMITPAVITRCAVVGVLSVALLVVFACGSSSRARTAKRRQASHHRSPRYICAHRRSGREVTSLDRECGSLFDWPLPPRPRLLHGSQTQSASMIGRIMTMGGGGIRPAPLNPEPGHDYGHPRFVSSPSDPVYRVHCSRSAPHQCPIEGWRIHIPARARPADGTDAHMSVLDYAANREYDFYHVQSVPLPASGGTIVIEWGGRSRISGSGAGSDSSCADAACTPLLDGVIRYPELAAGQINHALFIVVGCSNGRVTYPASSSGGGGACDDRTNAPATGQWLQLAMSPAQIDALRVPDWKKAIYRALARYGAMIGDEGSTGSFDFMIESPETYTSLGMANPFIGWAAAQRQRQPRHVSAFVAGGAVRYTLSFNDKITRRLRVIDPCVIAGTCS